MHLETVRHRGVREALVVGLVGFGAVAIALLGQVQFTQGLVQQVLVGPHPQLVIGPGNGIRALLVAEHHRQHAQAVLRQFLVAPRQSVQAVVLRYQLVQGGGEGHHRVVVATLLETGPALHVQGVGKVRRLRARLYHPGIGHLRLPVVGGGEVALPAAELRFGRVRRVRPVGVEPLQRRQRAGGVAVHLMGARQLVQQLVIRGVVWILLQQRFVGGDGSGEQFSARLAGPQPGLRLQHLDVRQPVHYLAPGRLIVGYLQDIPVNPGELYQRHLRQRFACGRQGGGLQVRQGRLLVAGRYAQVAAATQQGQGQQRRQPVHRGTSGLPWS